MALEISLDQFSKISAGKYNAGQVGVDVKKDGTATLKKVNAHVHFTSLNTATIDPAQTLEIKEAFVKALAPHLRDAGQVDAIREELGLPATVGGTVSKGHAYEPLTRQEVRVILDKYMPPEARKARAAEASSIVSIREKVNQENLAAQPVRVGDQTLDVGKIGTDKINVDGRELSPQDGVTYAFVIEDAEGGMREVANELVSVLSRSSNGKMDLTELARKLNTITEYARIAAEHSHRPGDVGKLVNAALARVFDQLDNGRLAIVYQGIMSRELDGLKTEISRKLDNPATLPSQFDACESLFEGISRLEARVVSEVSYRIGIAKTPEKDRASFQSPVQRWCGDDAVPTAHGGKNEMTVTNLEILASRTTDEVLHGDEKRASVDARLRSHGFTAADTRRIGDMIRSNELTINIHLGSIVGWHAGLEPALGNSSFALRNTFSSKEARGMKMDSTGYLVKRDAVEKYYFPEYSSAEMKGQERPLYAAFNPMKAESGGIGKSSSYGGTVVILKQHVKQQATYTLDDSFYKLVVSTSDDARDSFKAALAEAFRSKLSSENFNKFFGPDGTVAAMIDSQYVTFSGRDLTAMDTEPFCRALGGMLADVQTGEGRALDADDIHAIMISTTAKDAAPSSLTATYDNIETLLATRRDAQAVGFGVSVLRRMKDPDAPVRMVGCDYIEAQLHGPIVLGRDVEEIRISEAEILEHVDEEFKELADKPEGDAKKQWIALRMNEHKKEIEAMAKQSGVKISFYDGSADPDTAAICSEHHMQDLWQTHNLTRESSLKAVNDVLGGDMVATCRHCHATCLDRERNALSKEFGENLANLPDWLRDHCRAAGRNVIRTINDKRDYDILDKADAVNVLEQHVASALNDIAQVIIALDKHGVTDAGKREAILREFATKKLPRGKADSFVAINAAIDRVAQSPKTIVAAAMASGIPAYIQTELSELGVKDGLPLDGRGLENLTKKVVAFLDAKISTEGTLDVEKLIAEARDTVVVPALKDRIDLLRPIANWDFPSDDERNAFVSWAVNAGRLKNLEVVKSVYETCGTLTDSLYDALKGDGALDVKGLMDIYHAFTDTLAKSEPWVARASGEYGSDDLHAVIFRPVHVAMSRLFLRVGQEGMDKLGAALATQDFRALFSAVGAAFGDSKVLAEHLDSTEMHKFFTFLQELGDRLSEKHGQNCKFDVKHVVPFSAVPPAIRQVLSGVDPELIGEMSRKAPFSASFRTIPAPANPTGLPTDLAGRKDFLRAMLSYYHEHEMAFDRGINTHGRTHATRAFVFANVLGNILAERGVPVDMNALCLGIAGHDSGRQGAGEDNWEEASADLTVATGERMTGGAGGTAWCGAVKANIAGKSKALAPQRTIEGYLLKAADSLDYTRVDKLNPSHFHFLEGPFSCGEKLLTADPELRAELMKEAAELTRLTDAYAARKDKLDQLATAQKMEERNQVAEEVRKAEIAQTENISNEEIIALVEHTIRENADMFPLLAKYYR